MASVVSAISANWNPANVDGTTPTIDEIYDHTQIALQDGDFVLLYSLPSSFDPADLNYTTEDKVDTVSIDIRTCDSRSRMIKLRDEVKRVLEVKRKTIDNYNHIKVIAGRDLSNRSRKIFRYVFDLEMLEFNKAVSN